MRTLRLVLKLAAAAAVFTAAACGAGNRTAVPGDSPNLAALIPPPEVLQRRVSEDPGQRYLYGSHFLDLDDYVDVTWQTDNGAIATLNNTATFTPNSGQSGLGQFAWALYEFNAPSYGGPPVITTNWETPPDELWVGMFDAGKFAEWTTSVSAVHTVNAGDKGLTPTDNGLVHVLVLVSGATPAVLESIQLGAEARLTATPAGSTVPAPVTFNAYLPWDFNGAFATADYDFDGDGTIDLVDGGFEVTHTYLAEGTFLPTVTIHDESFGDFEATARIVLQGLNVPPEACAEVSYVAPLNFGERWAMATDDVFFSADNSVDRDGRIVKVEWDWDHDGTYDEDTGENRVENIFHQFADLGLRTIGLKVTDNNGEFDEDTCEVYIIGGPPDEVEPNSTFLLANNLASFPGTPVDGFEGNVGLGGDDGSYEDWYEFSIPAGPDQWVRLETHTGSFGWAHMKLYDGDGTTLLQTAELDPTGEHVDHLCDPGDYYACVWTEPLYPEADYCMSACAAPALPVADMICSATSGECPLLVQCEACPDLGPCDIGIAEILWDLDNDGNFEHGYDWQTLDNQRVINIPYYAIGTTTAMVQITDVLGNVTTDTVAVNVTGTVTENEPNDGKLQAKKFKFDTSFGEFVMGAVGVDSPGGSIDDWFSYTIPRAGSVKFTVAGAANLNKVQVYIYAPDGTTIRASLDQNSNFIVANDSPVSGGTYYVRVLAVPGTGSGGYSLTGRYTPTPNSPGP